MSFALLALSSFKKNMHLSYFIENVEKVNRLRRIYSPVNFLNRPWSVAFDIGSLLEFMARVLYS